MTPGGIDSTGGSAAPGSPALLVCVVHSLDQALAAAQDAQARGLGLHLESPAGAGATLGFGWFASLVERVARRYPDLTVTSCLDCADLHASAIGAMRRGLRHIRCSGPPETMRRLDAIARQFGAVVEHGPYLIPS